MVAFKDLQSDAGLKALNEHLATRSYIEGYQPSGADSALLPQIAASVDSSKYPHAARWLSHISSFPPTTRSTWSGASSISKSSAPAKGGKPAAAPAKAAAAPAEEEEETTTTSWPPCPTTRTRTAERPRRR